MARTKKEFVFPSSETDVKRIQNAIEEFSASLTRVAAEKDLQKQIFLALKEGDEEENIPGVEIPKGLFTKMAKTYHESNFGEVVSSNDKFEQTYTKLMKDVDPSVMADDE